MLFEYLPQNEDELELKVGDVIDISEEVSCVTELLSSSCVQKQSLYLRVNYKNVGKIAFKAAY